MNLIYKETFWEFYTANQADVELIMKAACLKQSNRVDADDLRSELLVRLQRSSFLKRFDPDKAALNTHFTNVCNGYARHIVTTETWKPTYIGESSWSRAYDLDVDTLEHAEDTDSSVCESDFLSKLKEAISPTSREMLKLKYEDDLRAKDIAKVFKKSVQQVSEKNAKLKEECNSAYHRLTNTKPTVKNGNNHKVAKKRPLTTLERNMIRERFIVQNGQFERYEAAALRTQLNQSVSIFQVTGYITTLHGEVSKGNLTLGNRSAYDRFIESHRRHWRTYKGKKYDKMRAADALEVA